MDNQHKLIKGYRDLSQSEIDVMNKIKAKGEELRSLIEEIMLIDGIDYRWLEQGTMDLKTGIMGLVRSVAKPESF